MHMKQLQYFVCVLTASAVLFSACKKELKPGEAPAKETNALQQSTGSGTLNGQRASSISLLKSNSQDEIYGNVIEQLLSGVTPTPCNPATPLGLWLEQQLSDWSPELKAEVLQYQMHFLAADYAFFFENSSANQSFGINGQYNHIMAKTFKDLRRFWDMESQGIVLVAMHGSTLTDKEKIASSLIANYDYTRPFAENWADHVLELLAENPQLRNGNHPYFTFNAYAFRRVDFTQYGLGILPYKIVMGDGLFQVFSELGYDDVAPQEILAHEFGHQVQYLYNLIPPGPKTPELNRRVELMADAFSAYYLSHPRGAAMQWNRAKEFLQVFFNLGRCNFDEPNHHGTPTQRMAAAEWAYNLANNTQPQGKILSVAEFVALFEAILPTLYLQ